jgi:cob(I)alamin adenosyltransferase
VARAITRRAERRCVTMMKKKLLNNRDIIVYLNRLSDLLYLLARFNEKK